MTLVKNYHFLASHQPKKLLFFLKQNLFKSLIIKDAGETAGMRHRTATDTDLWLSGITPMTLLNKRLSYQSCQWSLNVSLYIISPLVPTLRTKLEISSCLSSGNICRAAKPGLALRICMVYWHLQSCISSYIGQECWLKPGESPHTLWRRL